MSKFNWKKIIKNDTFAASVLGGFLLCLATFLTNMNTPTMDYIMPAILGALIVFLAIKLAKWMKKW